jgi:hypothetical protein
MDLPQKGGCQCGRLRYAITEAPLLTYACHCTDCQRMTSSAFSLAVVVADRAFRLEGVDPRLIQRTADSGRTANRWVCPDCSSWICSGPKPGTAAPEELRRVRAGTLDDTSWVQPTLHYFTRSKQPWFTLPEGSVSFETQPEDLTPFLSPPR